MKKYFMLLVLMSQTLTGHFAFAAPELVEKIVAIVNAEVITLSDVQNFNKKVNRPGFLDDLLLLGKTAETLKSSKQDQLDYLINEKILDSEIKRLNLGVTSEKVDQEIAEIAKRNGVSSAELLVAVKGQGVSVSDYQDFIRTKIERQTLIGNEISSKINISDEEILSEYLKENPNSESTVFEYTISHIFFNPRKGGLESAKERADRVLRKLDSGENFEQMAEQNTEDTNFSSGGLLGTFKGSELSKDFESAIHNLEVGQHSGVVSSKAGLHILKVLAKKVVSDPKFTAQKDKLRGVLFEKSFQKAFKDWLVAKKEASFIRINP